VQLKEMLNSDARLYSGGGQGNMGGLDVYSGDRA
jgi:hypothetical protein